MNTITKLPMKTKIFFSFGQFSDSIPFNLFYIFFLYFLTDVAGVNPAFGGTIVLIVVLWDAITDPLVGYLSDNLKSRFGRRKPFMLAGAIPLYICTILLFTAVDLSDNLKLAYYIFFGILFWTVYTMYVIPFFALGAELTQDFNERNNLRSIAGYFIYFAVWLVSAGPMMVLDRVMAAGGTEAQAWQYSASIFGFVGLLGAMICIFLVKNPVPQDNEEVVQDESKVNIFKNYIELFKVKAVRRLLGVIFFACVSFAVASGGFVYMMTYYLGLSAAKQALFWSSYTVITFIIIPICNISANKLGKKQAMILLDIIGVISCIGFYVWGIGSFAMLLVFTFLVQLGNVGFWTIGYSLTYDCCELDEYKYGKRREGAITGLASFLQKLGSAIGMQFSGLLLAKVGYDATLETQTAETVKGILGINTLLPALFISLSVIFLILYPINRKNFAALLQAIQARKSNQPYSEDEFQGLL